MSYVVMPSDRVKAMAQDMLDRIKARRMAERELLYADYRAEKTLFGRKPYAAYTDEEIERLAAGRDSLYCPNPFRSIDRLHIEAEKIALQLSWAADQALEVHVSTADLAAII